MELFDKQAFGESQSSENPTLLFVVNVDWFFLSHRLPIAVEALRLGYQVHIATALTDGLVQLQSYGLVVHPLVLNRSNTGICNMLHTMWQLLKVFRSVRPDVVHLVTIKPVILGGLAARLACVPALVAAVSGLGFVFMASGTMAGVRRWLVGGLYRVALSHHNLKVIFQNPDDRSSVEKLMHLPINKVEMIRGSGVDLTLYHHTPLPVGVPVVLLAARMLADKGVREFVQAARLLKQHGVSARFCLVGAIDSENPASLTDAELAQWASEDVVELWGHRSDMHEVLRTSYLVVLPSYREGLPKVLLEAAACARAVVTTDVPGCRDAIEPGVTGLLVPARNAKALADALRELINNPARCKAMGDAGRRLAEASFDIQQVVASHLRIYQELINKS
jgi:glycosyltransferase involved in cell wall biosynthesis